MAFSFDLETGDFSKISMTQTQYSPVSGSKLKFSPDLKFDSSTFFSLGQDDNSTAVYAMEYTNIVIENKYHSLDSLWAVLVGNLNSIHHLGYLS